MSPTPLENSTVHLTLQYISPPSQLDRPLPPHLLSKSLLQRHHFLDISHENPFDYLCWPSDSSAKAVDLLESRPSSHDDEPQLYPIHYASDAENTYAHVALPPAGSDGEAARLVFQWDNNGWKFHNTALMPFPPASAASLRDVLVAHEPVAASNTSSHISPQSNSHGFGHSADDGSDDDDDYWNAYGADDDDSSQPRQSHTAREETDDGEDAYWAQYSSVHGTADSTIPTPPIVRRKQTYGYHEDSADTDYQHPLAVPARNDVPDVPGEALHIPNALNDLPPRWLHHHNPRWGPACPKALAQLLADISPRQSPPQFAAIIPDFEDDLELSPPLAGSSDDSDTISSPDDDILGTIPARNDEDRSGTTASGVPTEQLPAAEATSPVSAIEEPLRQSLQGLFALWKSSRSQEGPISEEETRQSFLRIVGEVVSSR